jgi:uncharacterized protein with HEPN domain
MSRRSPQVLLTDLLAHAQRVVDIVGERSVPELEADQTRQDAILWNLIVLGEIAIRMPESIRIELPQIPWQAIIDQRNVIAHGYDVLDWSRLHALAKDHLRSLIEAAQRALGAYGPPPES